MIKWLIISDDLTGALDAGAQFAKHGMRTKVIAYDQPGQLRFDDCDVLVCDLESRHVRSDEAYSKVFQLVRSALEKGATYIYKKVDSTQRGNVGSELDAVIDASHRSRFFYAPTYPEQRRIVRDGIVYVNGVPLLGSDVPNDKFSHLSSSYLPEIIAAQSARASEVVTIDRLKSGDWRGGDGDVTVIDAQSDEDLREIADFLLDRYGDTAIYSGSAGFANAIAENLRRDGPWQPEIERRWDRVMIVCGSLSRVSQEQLCVLEEAGIPCVMLDEETLLCENESTDYGLDQLFLHAYNLLQQDDAVVMRHDFLSADQIQSPDAEEGGQDTVPRHLQIAIRTGKLVSRVTKKLNIPLLVVIGGDTLFGVLRSLEFVDIFPKFEILPGAIYSLVHLASGDEISIVSKAGGFGQQNTLMEILERLTK